MRPASCLVLALLALASSVGPAAAGGSLETPVAVLVVEDGFDACAAPVAGFCAFDADASGDPGDWSVDAYQQVAYVGVAANGSLVGLDDRSLVVHGDELYVEHPAFRVATWAWESVRDDVPLPEGYDVRSTRDNVTVEYVGPSTKDPFHPMAPRAWSYEHGNEQGVGYDRAGPFLQPTGTDTDHDVDGIRASCAVVPVEPCASGTQAVVDAATQATPDVRFGFEFYDVEVASDPSELGGDAPHGNAGGRPNARASAASPLAPGRRDAPAPHPAPADDGSSAPPARPALPASAVRSGPTAGPASVQAAGGRVAVSPFLAAAAVVGAVLLLAAGLYTRLSRGAVPRQEARQAILRAVEARPGIRLADLVNDVGMGRTAVAYHVGVLERAGLLDVVARGNRKCIALKGVLAEAPVTGLKLRGHVVRTLLLDAVRRAPEGLARRDAHVLLADVPRRTRNHTIRILTRDGILCEAPGADGEPRLFAAFPEQPFLQSA